MKSASKQENCYVPTEAIENMNRSSLSKKENTIKFALTDTKETAPKDVQKLGLIPSKVEHR